MSISSKRKFAYIAHPLMHSGDSDDMKVNFETNVKNIKRICQYMIDEIKKEEGIVSGLSSYIGGGIFKGTSGGDTPYPLAPQIYLPVLLNESRADKEQYEVQRRIAIDFCMLLLSKCDIVHLYRPDWFGGGVIDDVEEASKLGIPIKVVKQYPWEEQ